MGSEPAAPAVVPAVVVVLIACDPGEWLDESLRSLAAQDYGNFSVKVVVTGSAAGVADQVAKVLPAATLLRAEGASFAEAANRALGKVEGVAHALLCHDDVALAPDALRLLVEEAYRRNGGLTCPKLVLWDAPERLLSVGLGADRLGVTHRLVEPGELDQGQQDAAREVFVAPSAAVLVRVDLWKALEGFDSTLRGRGVDLDLSWRAQLAGARVVVAPQARVRHLEAGATGRARGLRRSGPGTAARARPTGPTAPTGTGVAGASAPPAAPTDAAPTDAAPTDAAPTDAAPTDAAPTDAAPTDAAPTDAAPTDAAPTGPSGPTGGANAAHNGIISVTTRPNGLKGLSVRRADGKGPAAGPSSGEAAGLAQSSGEATGSPWRSSEAAGLAPSSGEAAASARSIDPSRASGCRGDEAGTSLEEQEANRLRTLWTCYSRWALVLVAPISVFFALVQTAWDLAHHRRLGEALVPVRALGRSLRQPGNLWRSRRRAQALRRVSDRAIWRAQTRGSAQLRALVRRRLERGHQLAWAAARATSSEPRRPAPGATNWRASLALGAGVVAMVLIGSRGTLGQAFPLVGQMPSTVGGVGGWWHAWWAGSGAGGLGGAGESLPAMFSLGVLGLLAAGSANVALHMLVFGAMLLGPLGVYVETKAFGSYRGRVAATLVYAALPLPYNALAQGHPAGLVAYAAAPWAIGQLGRLSVAAPFAEGGGRRSWARFVALGLLLAVAASLAPAVAALVLLSGVAMSGGTLLSGSTVGAWRLASRAVLIVAVSIVALLPWSAHVLGSWSALVGNRAPTAGLGLPQVLRFDTGPFGSGVLAWAVLVAAAACVFIGRSWRLAWAARLWAVALACFFLAWGSQRGWFSLPDLEVVLAPAGAALAFCTALGGAAVETDLSGYRFGWHQLVPGLGALAVLAAFLPLAGWALNGQWDLPASGAEASYAYPGPSPAGDYRVLWAGPEEDIPLAPDGHVGAVAFATSADGLPVAAQLWSSAGPGAAPVLAEDLGWAVDGQTTGLGRLLGPLGVRYVVVPTPGTGLPAGPAPRAAAQDLVSALSKQLDLVPVGSQPGYTVFSNTDWSPLFTVLRAPAPASPSPALLLRAGAGRAEPLEVGPQGQARAIAPAEGTVFAGEPYGSWTARVAGRRLAPERAFGWAGQWSLPPRSQGATLSLSPSGTAGRHAVDVVMLVAWGLALALAGAGLRSRWRAQLAQATLGLGLPGDEVSEINWGVVTEDETVG